ncbi:MAG: GNAT family N-acetyltransferase [Brooklawnia sp.]|jgi:GNAT superfamily N-acetyltransferase
MDTTNRANLALEIRPFDRALVKRATTFSCGHPDLDMWLRQHAGQQERRNNTRTYLGVVAQTRQLVGYYATTAYRIERDDESLRYEAGRRRYPIAAVLLARLAVDTHWTGCGFGKQLLVDALRRIADASTAVGFELVVVDAIDDTAVTFYARFGFTQFEHHPRKLYLPTKHLLATLNSG